MVTGNEHWTTKKTADGDVKLFLWEKFVGSPDGKPAVLFVHGSSMASQPTFDLSVPGRPDSSVMDWFAERGFVCWCVDMEGYGRSDKTRDTYCDIANESGRPGTLRSKVGCEAIDEPCTNSTAGLPSGTPTNRSEEHTSELQSR